MKIAIMGAMPEEVQFIVEHLGELSITEISKRKYYTGKLEGINCVVVNCGDWGKVAAASCAQTLISKFLIDHLIFTGVAGAINKKMKIGDIVICEKTVQHDFKLSQAMIDIGRNVIRVPLLGVGHLEADSRLKEIAFMACDEMLKMHLSEIIPLEQQQRFQIVKPQVHLGICLTGDEFIDDPERKKELSKNYPGALCVEMEGAAVAQVCIIENIPHIIIRTISDVAEKSAQKDFPGFVQNIASQYSYQLVNTIVRKISELIGQ